MADIINFLYIHGEHLGVIVSFIFLFSYFAMQMLNRKYIELMEKLFKLPLPICIVSYHLNRVIYSNDTFKDTFINDDNIGTCNIYKMGIFHNANDYISIKKDIKNNLVNKKYINLMVNGETKYYEVFYFPVINKIIKNNIVIAFTECSISAQYIRCLGVFSSIIDNSPDGIIIAKYNENNIPVIRYANNSIYNLTGYKPIELVDLPITTMYNLSVDDKIYNMIETNIINMEPMSLEFQYTRKDGSLCWLQSDFNIVNDTKIQNTLSTLACINYSQDEMPDISKELYITVHKKDMSENKKIKENSKFLIDKENKYIECMSECLDVISSKKDRRTTIANMFELLSKWFDCPRLFTIEFDNNLNFEINNEYLTGDLESMNTIINSYDLSATNNGLIEIYGNLNNKKVVRINSESTKTFHKYIRNNWSTYWKDTSSILIPVVVNSELKLVLTLCDNNGNRVWSAEEEKILYAITQSIYKVLHS